jgi:hypothetical protein
METRKLKQYGWISGPVECCCTACDWSVSFTASDSSLPGHIASAFAEHNCSDYCEPQPVVQKHAQL